MRHLLIVLAFFCHAPADEPAPITVAVPDRKEPVSYAKEIADILDAKCVGCHSGALAENKLNLEEVAGMLKGGKRGPAVVPGKAEESLLFKLAAHRMEPFMPPKDKKGNKPLTPQELGLIKLWIDAGAKDDSDVSAEAPKPIELGTLPPGVQPIVAVDLTADGKRLAAGRANLVQVYDADSGLEIVALGGHKDIIQSLRFSPDGHRLAAGSYQTVTVWNLPTGGLAKTFQGHGNQVRALAAPPGGKSFTSAGLDQTIRVWDLAEGKEIRKYDLPAQALAIALAPDGQTLAWGGSDNNVHILNLADGKERLALKGHGGAVVAVAFLADGTRLASASEDGTARIWTLPTGPAAAPAEPIVLNGHKGPLRAVAVVPDGQLIATGGDDGTVRLWHAIDGRAAHTFTNHQGPVLALAISPDGKILLTGSADKSACLFNLDTGTLKKTLTTHNGPIRAVAFSPTGDRCATADEEGGVKVWNTKEARGILAFGHVPQDPNAPLPPIHAVAFVSEDSLITGSNDHTIKSWTVVGDWSAQRPLGPHVFRVLAIDFSPDGSLIATGGGEPSRSGEVKVWEIHKGFLVRSFENLHSDTVFGVRFSPDGSKLATCAADKFMKVVNLIGGKELRSFEGHTHHVMAVDWKSDGKQLVTGGADNVLKIWDFETGDQVRTLQAAGKQITAVRWLPGKPQVAGASGDQQVRFWNADNGGIERQFSGPSDFVFSVATSADGSRVAAGGADSVLFLWRGDNVQVLRKIEPGPRTPAVP
jgi:WD40 repeat protein